MNDDNLTKSIELFIDKCIVDSKKDRIKYELIKKKSHMINRFAHNPTDLICAEKIVLSTKKLEDIKKQFDSICLLDYYDYFDERLGVGSEYFFETIKNEYGPIIGLSDKYAVIKDEDCNYYLIDFFKEKNNVLF